MRIHEITHSLTESFLGKNKNTILNMLYSEIGAGPFDGGCVVIARALQIKYGGEIYVLVGRAQRASTKPVALHAVLKLGNRFVDANGVYTIDEFVELFTENELKHSGGRVTSFRPLLNTDLSDAPRDETLSIKIAKLLR